MSVRVGGGHTSPDRYRIASTCDIEEVPVATIGRDLPDMATILARFERRIERLERSYLRFPALQTVAASLTAVTTDPTMGTGAVATTTFVQRGSWVEAVTHFVFGTSAGAGSGVYRVSLPVSVQAALPDSQVVGSGHVFDTSTSTFYTIAAYMDGANLTRVRLSLDAGGNVSSAAPVTFADGDRISLHLSYPVDRLATS